MRIVWFSRHSILHSQRKELQRLFGEDVEIIPDPQPFATADEVVSRFRRAKADEMVVVAPLSVISALCERGLKPLYAEMEMVPREKAEVVVNGRGFRFVRFKRIKRLALEFEEI